MPKYSPVGTIGKKQTLDLAPFGEKLFFNIVGVTNKEIPNLTIAPSSVRFEIDYQTTDGLT